MPTSNDLSSFYTDEGVNLIFVPAVEDIYVSNNGEHPRELTYAMKECASEAVRSVRNSQTDADRGEADSLYYAGLSSENRPAAAGDWPLSILSIHNPKASGGYQS